MSVTWNGAAAKEKMLNEAARRMQRTAQYFQTQVMARFSVSNPRPYLNSSKPGEYPRKRTGNLIANILWGPTSISDIKAEGLKVRAGVGAPARYGAILELFKARLGFVRTAEDLRPVLKVMLEGKV
jgi:hypothetical protein